MSDLPPKARLPHGPTNDAGDGQVILATQARQGRNGLQMPIVLAVSTLLAIVAMFGFWSVIAGPMNHAAHASGASKAIASKTFNVGPSQPREAPNTPSGN